MRKRKRMQTIGILIMVFVMSLSGLTLAAAQGETESGSGTSVRITVEDAGAGESSQIFMKKFGEEVRIYAKGERFCYWTNSYGLIVSRSRDYVFTAVCNETLTANYEEENMVVWRTESGQVIKSGVYKGGTIQEQDIPPVPELLGYADMGWKLGAAELNGLLQKESSPITNRAEYTRKDNVYRITIENGTINRTEGQYRQNEVVIATANAAPAGMKFSHWEDARTYHRGDVLSYQQEYKFYAISNFSLRAVYIKETDDVQVGGTAQITRVLRNEEDTKTSFIAQFSVSSGCQMEFAGVLATQDPEKGLDLRRENADYVRGKSVGVTFYQYTWNKTTGADEMWFVRPYLVYRDAQGNLNEVYGELEREQEVIVLTPEMFGAKADGVTDDLPAFCSMIHTARNYYDGFYDHKRTVELRLKENATYYVSDVENAKIPGTNVEYALDLRRLHGLLVKGKNTTISVDLTHGLYGFVNMDYCDDIQIEGLNLKTAKSVYAIGTVLGANYDSKDYYIDIQSDRDLEFEGTYSYVDGLYKDAFGLSFTDYNRAHMYIESIEVLDANAWKYRVHLKDMDNVRHKMESMIRDNLKFLVPRPNWGQEEGTGSGAFIVTNTTNLRMENINLWSSAGFCFHMRYDEGKILVRNVNVTPEPGTDMAMSGWRDGFHLKDNPGQFIFEDCRIERNFDDAFNTGTSGLKISKVYSERELELYCNEFGGTYYGRIEAGDTLRIYDEIDGSFVAFAKVKEWVNSEDSKAPRHIILETPVSGLKEGFSASPVEAGQPGMVMKNCYINGTYRFRTPLTCENTEFATMYAWFDNLPGFSGSVEGPAASNQHFINCKFYRVAAPNSSDSFGSSEYMMEIGTNIINWQNHQGVLKVENIVFEDCEINPNLIAWKGGYDVTINGTRYQSKQY